MLRYEIIPFDVGEIKDFWEILSLELDIYYHDMMPVSSLSFPPNIPKDLASCFCLINEVDMAQSHKVPDVVYAAVIDEYFESGGKW